MGKDSLNFTGPKHLLRWLQDHAKGQSLLHTATVEMCEGCRHQRRPVLLVLHPDGGVELYWRGGLNIHVVNAFHSPNEASEQFQERYISFRLPESHRQLYTGWKQGWIGRCRAKTIDDEIDHLRALVLLRDVEGWKQRYRGKFGEKAIDEIARDVRVSVLG